MTILDQHANVRAVRRADVHSTALTRYPDSSSPTVISWHWSAMAMQTMMATKAAAPPKRAAVKPRAMKAAKAAAPPKSTKAAAKAAQKEREAARQEEDAIEKAHEEDQVKLSLKELEQLAKEEERLLGSVTKVHAQHREEVTKLEAAAAAVGRPHLLEAARPSPFAITKPLPPDSPRMARKPSSPKPPSSPRSPRRELWER